MPKREYLKTGELSEHSIQVTICNWLRWQKVVFLAIPNEAANNPITGKRLKARGLKKGASDLIILKACHNFHGMFLEVKSKGGVLSPHQIEFFRQVEAENYYTAACWSIEEGIEHLKWYLGKK